MEIFYGRACAVCIKLGGGGAQAGWPGSTLSSFKLCFLPAKHTESDVFIGENSTTAHLNFFPFNTPNVSYHYMASNIFYDEGFF